MQSDEANKRTEERPFQVIELGKQEEAKAKLNTVQIDKRETYSHPLPFRAGKVARSQGRWWPHSGRELSHQRSSADIAG